MRFDPPLQPAIFLRRYKRFLADVELPDSTQLTVHCPNTGSMRGLLEPGVKAMISTSDNPKRKYPHTLEMLKSGVTWVGINTARTNHLVREGMEAGLIKELGRPETIQPEVKTSEGSRLDFLLHSGGEKTYVEVKNCTLVEGGVAMFPDAVTARGTKHLRELMTLKSQGHGAAVLFCVQRMDGRSFTPASHIDPLYGRTLAEAAACGVLVLAYEARVGPQGVTISHSLPVTL